MKLLFDNEVKEQEVRDEVRKSELKKVKEDLKLSKTRVGELESEIKTLKANIEQKDKLAQKEISLKSREGLLDAREKALATFDDTVKQLTTKAEKSKEEGHKAGYADGLADGLRKAHEITAEDRRMMAQIAALAAASHTPAAAQELGSTIAKMLPSVSGNGK